jgi:hypothetical protein
MDFINNLLDVKVDYSLQSGNEFMNLCEILLLIAQMSIDNNCKSYNKLTSILDFDRFKQGQISYNWTGGVRTWKNKFPKQMEELIEKIKIIYTEKKIKYLIIPITLVEDSYGFKDLSDISSHSNLLFIYFHPDRIFSFHIEPHGKISTSMNEYYNYDKFIECLETNLNQIGLFATTSKLQHYFTIQGTESFKSIYQYLRIEKNRRVLYYLGLYYYQNLITFYRK